MTRFAWIQFRTQALVAYAGLALVAVALVLTGPHLAHLYDSTVANCATHGNCDTVTQLFIRHDAALQTWLDVFMIVVPLVVGVFWGAPLVARELETGTFRLAWTQSVTRTRWLAVKLAVVGLTGMAVAGLLSLMVTWWSSPFDKVNQSQFDVTAFSERGIVAIGYAAFAFALGVAAGVLIRRTLPAMAATLVAFFVARVGFAQSIRPALMAPAHLESSLANGVAGFGSFNGGPFTLLAKTAPPVNSWAYSTKIVDNHGRELAASTVSRVCPQLGASLPANPKGGGGGGFRGPVPSQIDNALHSCVAKLAGNYHVVLTYQPANRYWTFQWMELGIFLGVALLLGGFSVWWVRRRLR
jgi:ABC-type transport system involved in multi-copper enzyme maturation permease subunit